MPDIYQEMMKRFEILQTIRDDEPIGRRTLSKKLAISETSLRKKIDFLKNVQLIQVDANGMKLTTSGREATIEIASLIKEKAMSDEMEQELAQHLGIERCIIIPGNVDDNYAAFEQLGKKTNAILEQFITHDATIIAVTGGSTMKMVAVQMEEHYPADGQDLIFVSARGGLNEEPTLEANEIAQTMANKYHSKSRRLYAPNYVQPQLYSSIINVPDIHDTLQLVEKASVVLYSIGEPIEMAKRRRLPGEVINYLLEHKVVAEAFGEFINTKGEVIYKLSNIGLQFKTLSSVPHVLIVSGGIKKAPAIEAHMRIAPDHAWLVTDEAAAKWILKGK